MGSYSQMNRPVSSRTTRADLPTAGAPRTTSLESALGEFFLCPAEDAKVVAPVQGDRCVAAVIVVVLEERPELLLVVVTALLAVVVLATLRVEVLVMEAAVRVVVVLLLGLVLALEEAAAARVELGLVLVEREGMWEGGVRRKSGELWLCIGLLVELWTVALVLLADVQVAVLSVAAVDLAAGDLAEEAAQVVVTVDVVFAAGQVDPLVVATL